MNGLTLDVEHSKATALRCVRQTLLYLPPTTLDGHVSSDLTASDNDKNYMKLSNNFTTMNLAALPTTLAIPIDAIELSGRRKSDWTIDEQIAAGYYPVLLQVNESLRQQNPLLLLPNSGKALENTIHEVTEPTKSSFASISPVSTQSQRILYVGQGEIAHCTAAQVDILVSDRATTCHILALRSSCCCRRLCKNLADSTLCTIAHIDSANYNRCIYDAFQTHYEFHSSRCLNTSEDAVTPSIKLDIHIVGGFKDTSSGSRTITTWIMNVLADLADKYSTKDPSMTMMVQTACITAANQNYKNGGPVVRGLALDCNDGKVFAAHVKHPRPAMELRQAKIWISGHRPNNCDPTSVSKLRMIHTYHNDVVVIEPLFVDESRSCQCGFIQHQMQQQFQYLLGIRDDKIILKYCSTSPEYEEDDFCETTRSSLMFVLQQYNSVPSVISPLRFTRVDSNTWMQI